MAEFVLDSVAVAYRVAEGIRPVLADLQLRISKGEWVAIVGRNGSGKSTLARVLAGLCPISRGKFICEALTTDRSSVQMIFQNPDAQIVGETVYEDVCFGLENKAVPPEDIPARACAALSAVGLEHAQHRRVEHLSGGQKQLLCVADALAMNATALIFDEATSMLDPLSRQKILHAAMRLREQGKTIIWVTQLMEEVGYANKVVALDVGRKVFDGTPTQFFYGENDKSSAESPCISLGFVPPYNVQVAQHLLKAGVHLLSYPVLPEQLGDAVSKLCQ